MRALIIGLMLCFALPSASIAANRVVTLAPGHLLAGAVRVGAAS